MLEDLGSMHAPLNPKSMEIDKLKRSVEGEQELLKERCEGERGRLGGILVSRIQV